ncbi:oxidoreductase C-terminal domain-containing protein [Protofrankia symbiont of Coriaria ruscifolia]|uniref:oxidoreductase C-terminal domain-containing protein n=1 Tax=Protofrankia symbiont of Coriaria ruscifolia TaxID=1306542 RepID=UPI001F5F0679|nr:oxidoreductase C-terminal domain-containing protein [Protofrankia symbiont of Coriaria ruscifolia]
MSSPPARGPANWSYWYDSRIQFVGVPQADEIRVVWGSVDEHRFVALYRQGDRVTGALAVNGQREIMKYRMQIGRRTSWEEALEFAAKRNAAAPASA